MLNQNHIAYILHSPLPRFRYLCGRGGKSIRARGHCGLHGSSVFQTEQGSFTQELMVLITVCISMKDPAIPNPSAEKGVVQDIPFLAMELLGIFNYWDMKEEFSLGLQILVSQPRVNVQKTTQPRIFGKCKFVLMSKQKGQATKLGGWGRVHYGRVKTHCMKLKN